VRTVFCDALIDSVKMIPFLLFVYYVVEWLEYQYGLAIRARIQRNAKAGPLAGAVFGCVPQCGFSVLASAMYTRRFVTIGTLLAVYLSTSDEAVPVILAQPKKLWVIVPLICTKVVIALIGGYVTDIAFRSYRKGVIVSDPEGLKEIEGHGCCEHHVVGEDSKRQLWLHPLVHTVKVFFFVFLVSFGINWLMFKVGAHNLGRLLLQHSPLQPVITAFVGLIPNCAASVAITQVFLKGGISYGSAVSGLCASGGLGLLVLLKENHNPRDTAKVLGLLLAFSIAAGIAIQYLYG
jgi:hypothetical protein